MNDSQNSVYSALQGKSCLLAASTGGHLAQLVRLADHAGVDSSSIWVTFRNAQSLSLLRGRNVIFVDYIKSRDIKGVIRAAVEARKMFQERRFDTVISTGAGLALSFLPLAKSSADRVIYVESVSRFEGPSATGRLLQRIPFIETFTQHSGWATSRWQVTQGVLGSYSKAPKLRNKSYQNLFITLGTIEGYRFDRLIDAVLRLGIANESTVWQLGTTTRDDLPGHVHSHLDAESFKEAAIKADVVITHSGVGTILQLLDWGIYPLVVPRNSANHEHVDNHQFQIADYLSRHDLASTCNPDDLSLGHLATVSNYEIHPDSKGKPNE